MSDSECLICINKGQCKDYEPHFCLKCKTPIETQAKLEALEELKEDWNREPFRISPYYDRLNKRIEELKLTNVKKEEGQDG